MNMENYYNSKNISEDKKESLVLEKGKDNQEAENLETKETARQKIVRKAAFVHADTVDNSEFNNFIDESEDLFSKEEISFDRIEEIVNNPETFAKPLLEKEVYSYPDDIVVTGETLYFADGDYTNVYDLVLPSDDIDFGIVGSNNPQYQYKIMKQHLDTLAMINGPFFCLHDDKEMPPDVTLGAHMQDGKIFGLPSADRPLLYVKEGGEIEVEEMSARGEIRIGDQIVDWVGGERFAHGFEENTDGEETVLYNGACCTIEYDDPDTKGSRRSLNKERNLTPQSANKVDIVIGVDGNGEARVIAKNEGGNTDFFSGYYILHMHKNKAQTIKVGNYVQPLTIGNLDLGKITAMCTTGPMTEHFLENDDHPINHDLSLGNIPPFAPNARYARAVIYKDAMNQTHFLVFDGVPRSEHMPGATPREVAEFIPKDAKWSVFMDGGQSSRVTVRAGEENKTAAFGNRQYVRLPKKKLTTSQTNIKNMDSVAKADNRHLWSGSGRPVPMVITANLKKS